jgi:hypothetical protein
MNVKERTVDEALGLNGCQGRGEMSKATLASQVALLIQLKMFQTIVS